MENILLAYGLYKETVTAIMMLNKNMKMIVTLASMTSSLNSGKVIHKHHIYF